MCSVWVWVGLAYEKIHADGNNYYTTSRFYCYYYCTTAVRCVCAVVKWCRTCH